MNEVESRKIFGEIYNRIESGLSKKKKIINTFKNFEESFLPVWEKIDKNNSEQIKDFERISLKLLKDGGIDTILTRITEEQLLIKNEELTEAQNRLLQAIENPELASRFTGYKIFAPKSNGARAAGSEGGVYIEVSTGDKALIKQDKLSNTIGEYISAGIFKASAPDNSVEVGLIALKGRESPEKNGENQYLISKFRPDYLTELHKLMGKEDRPKAIKSRYNQSLNQLFENIATYNSLPSDDKEAYQWSKEKIKIWPKEVKALTKNKETYEAAKKQLKADFAKVMVPSIDTNDQDVTTANIGARIDENGNLRLVRLDYGWGCYQLTREFNPDAVYENFEAGKPTGHFSEYPDELKFSLEMAEEIHRYTSQEEQQKQREELIRRYSEIGSRYNNTALLKFAKHMGMAGEDIRALEQVVKDYPPEESARPGVVEYVQNWHLATKEKRTQYLKDFASNIELEHSIDRDAKGKWNIDTQKLHDSILKNPKYYAEIEKDEKKIEFHLLKKQADAELHELLQNKIKEISLSIQNKKVKQHEITPEKSFLNKAEWNPKEANRKIVEPWLEIGRDIKSNFENTQSYYNENKTGKAILSGMHGAWKSLVKSPSYLVQTAGAFVQSSLNLSGEGLKLLGHQTGKWLEQSRDKFSNSQGITSKIGWGMLLGVASVGKLLGGTAGAIGSGFEGLGKVVKEVTNIASKPLAALGSVLSLNLGQAKEEFLYGISATTRAVANIVQTPLDMVKEAGTQLKDLAIKANIPVLSFACRTIGSACQGAAQDSEGIVQGLRKCLVGEFKEGAKLAGLGLSSGCKTILTDIATGAIVDARTAVSAISKETGEKIRSERLEKFEKDAAPRNAFTELSGGIKFKERMDIASKGLTIESFGKNSDMVEPTHISKVQVPEKVANWVSKTKHNEESINKSINH